ncbi:hypothetical protein [Leucobacter tardus]|uniref:Uncharacterized protein n=1 Tax=Leucobacter tardus TaxID=501483 RepID=A0A939TM72_9MICO|nr:hypothetical protein [Leucobacter tardus]MBO2988874.1 hypothetical protein [Leucobacter tardus]
MFVDWCSLDHLQTRLCFPLTNSTAQNLEIIIMLFSDRFLDPADGLSYPATNLIADGNVARFRPHL